MHDEMCTRVEAEALQLALNVPEIKEDTDEAEVMQTYRDTLEQLGSFSLSIYLCAI